MVQVSDPTAGAATPTPATAATTSRVRLPSLTGLRFVAAFFVFLYHSSLTFTPIPGSPSTNPFANESVHTTYESVMRSLGYSGVSFFFLLSGFVLTWATPAGERARAFWRRRALKIYPNHIVTWAIAMVLFAAAATPIWQAVANLFLVHSWSWNSFAWVSINSPSWSLCAEVLFYALFPVLVVGIRRIPGHRLWAWAGLLVLGIFAVAAVAQFLLPAPEPPLPASWQQFWIGYFFPPVRLFEFTLGMVLARIVMEGRWPRIGMTIPAVLFVVAYVLVLELPYVWGFFSVTAIPLAMLICGAASADVSGSPSVFRHRWAIWLGDVSFAFYMCQGLVLVYGRGQFLNGQYATPQAIGVLLVFLAANLLAAWALYRLVERPIMRRWSRPTRRRPDELPAAETDAATSKA